VSNVKLGWAVNVILLFVALFTQAHSCPIENTPLGEYITAFAAFVNLGIFVILWMRKGSSFWKT